MTRPKKATGIVAAILATTVGVALVAGLVLLLTGTVDLDDASTTIMVEILVIVGLLAGGLVAYVSHDHHDHNHDDEGQL